MQFNLATTVSFCAAAMCASIAVLGAHLSRRMTSRHFRYAGVAGLAASIYCMTEAVLAGRCSVGTTLWAGKIGMLAMSIHAVAWVAFLAAWDRRGWSRTERLIGGASLIVGLTSLVPGAAVTSSVVERSVDWLGITYRDPDIGPLAIPAILIIYATHVVATRAAWRMSVHNPRARAVSTGLSIFCLVIPVDLLSATHVLPLPYLADPALAFVLLTIGSVIVFDAAESADKSVQLERARVALAERENLAALGQLAAVVAHEVRNPVAIIFGALTNLRRDVRNANDTTLLGIVGEEASRLESLVARLLDAVRPFELQYSRGLPEKLLKNAIAQVTGAGIAATEVEIVSCPTEDVECDEVMLVQAISNLVQNAVAATGRALPVRVLAFVEDESLPAMLRVEIIDDGEGVPAESRERLFTPFFTTRATGTGLGLALVKRIAAAHGGTIDYAPPPGGGACFVLRVPVRATDATPRYLIGNELR